MAHQACGQEVGNLGKGLWMAGPLVTPGGPTFLPLGLSAHLAWLWIECEHSTTLREQRGGQEPFRGKVALVAGPPSGLSHLCRYLTLMI